MKRMLAVIIGMTLAAAPCAASELTPKWFGWTMAGLAVGASALYLAQDSHMWRQHAIEDGLEGDRIWNSQENKYGLRYQERAISLWDARARRLRSANHIKSAAAILGAISVSCLGLGVTYGVAGLRVQKSVRFR